MRKRSQIAYNGSWCATKGPGLRRAALVAALLTIVAGLAAPERAEAGITRIEITRVESPTFEGTSFGTVGQYEKLAGRAYGEVDPAASRNAVIADLGLAPTNAAGKVEYSTDIYILRPVVQSQGNHRVLFDMNNRGGKFALLYLNDGPGSFPQPPNDPTTAADAGNGFLMRQGYTLVWSGWDATVTTGNSRLTMTVPIARNADGSSIVGPSLEEFVIDNSATTTGFLSYTAASLDKSLASLSVREHYADPPTPIPASDWGYVDSSGNAIRLLPVGTRFQQGRLYEFTYPAKDPLVVGLGFAATRDVAAFLRYAAADDDGNPNPLAGDAQSVYTFCFSLPCRFLHDFLRLGFNEDEQGRLAIDAMLNWVGGGSGGFFNYRFAQPSRTHRQHIGRWYPERQFPFANQVTFDPVTGTTDGVLRRCLATSTCPHIFESNSENEYWVKGGSLLHTDTLGNDLPDSEHARSYLFSSLPHGNASGLGICEQPRNPLLPNPGLRALLVELDQWVSAGTEPPDSHVPRAWRWNARPGTAPGQRRVPQHPRCHLQRAHHHRRPLRLRATVRSGHLDDPAAAAPGLALPGLRADHGCRRERRRRHPFAGRRGGAGDVFRLEPTRGSIRRGRPV